MLELAKRLLHVRNHFGFTQAEMAIKVNKSLGAWQSYEQNGSIPGGNVFLLLSKMGIDLNWLASGDGEMMRNVSPPLNATNDILSQPSTPADPEFKELMHLSAKDFWSLFYRYARLSPAQTGWSQMEIIRRFPEFRKWLKEDKIEDIRSGHVRKKTA